MKLLDKVFCAVVIASLILMVAVDNYHLRNYREDYRALEKERGERSVAFLKLQRDNNMLKENISSLNYENFNWQELYRQQLDEKMHPKVAFRVAGRADGTFAVEQWILHPYIGKVQVDQFQTVFWAKYMADLYQEEYDLGRDLSELKALK